MKKKLALALCLAALATPASARNAEDYWFGTPRIHLMMWIAKVQVWARASAHGSFWHFGDIARRWMNFRFRGKSGHAPDITAMTGFDPSGT